MSEWIVFVCLRSKKLHRLSVFHVKVEGKRLLLHSLSLCVLSDLKVETGSCGKTRGAGSTTSSGRRSRRPRAARSSSPSMDTTSETAAAPETGRTDSDGPGENNRMTRVRPRSPHSHHCIMMNVELLYVAPSRFTCGELLN